MEIDIQGLDKAAIVAALYNASKPLGMGFMRYDATPMQPTEAQVYLDNGQTEFDYLKGRVMKVNVGGDTLDPWGYDRDNGAGAAATVIAALRTGEINLRSRHIAGTTAAIAEATEAMHTGGLADVRQYVEPRIQKAKAQIENGAADAR